MPLAAPLAPRTVRRSPSLPIALIVVITAVLVGACEDTNPTPTPAAATLEPTTAPTASASAADVTDAFIKVIGSPDFSAMADISGTVSFGGAAGELSGDAIFAGPSSSMTMRIDVGGIIQETETISIGSKRWSREAPGPWLADADADPSEGSLSGTLSAIASVEDLGVVPRNGRPLHHLQPMGGGKIAPATIGFDVEGATDAVFVLDFFATDAGTPAIMDISGSWTQTEGEVVLPIEIDLEFAISAVGAPQAVAPPDDVWTMSTSATFPYRMAHPADWTVESSTTEDAYAIDGQPYVYVAPQAVDDGMTIDAFAAALQGFYKDDFGEPTSQVDRELGGLPAYRLVYEFTNDQGQDVTFVDDLTVRDGTGWEVFLVTAGGAEDVSIFNQFVATFAFSD